MTDGCVFKGASSTARFAIFFAAFVIMIGGGLTLCFLPSDLKHVIPVASMIPYTAAVMLYTFSSNRGGPRYLFRCPIVRQRTPTLIRRHIGFVAALVVLLTAALEIRPHLSSWWLESEDIPPFYLILWISAAAMALAEVLTNRSLLEDAHLAADPTRDDGPSRPAVRTLFNK